VSAVWVKLVSRGFLKISPEENIDSSFDSYIGSNYEQIVKHPHETIKYQKQQSEQQFLTTQLATLRHQQRRQHTKKQTGAYHLFDAQEIVALSFVICICYRQICYEVF